MFVVEDGKFIEYLFIEVVNLIMLDCKYFCECLF